MDSRQTNYFGIDNAENLSCRVEFYQNDLLKIGAYDEMNKFLLHFNFLTPIYIQFPKEWKGATFRLGNNDEQLAFWPRIGGDMTQEEFIKFSRLFIADVDLDTPTPKTVYIIASKATI